MRGGGRALFCPAGSLVRVQAGPACLGHGPQPLQVLRLQGKVQRQVLAHPSSVGRLGQGNHAAVQGEAQADLGLGDPVFPGQLRQQVIIRQPLVLTKLVDKFDVKVNVCGGGVTGQAEAVRHGSSRALLSADPSLRGVLKRAGFLTRDARKKERKKYGQRAARARYQYSKR